jgi:hypothetical protein
MGEHDLRHVAVITGSAPEHPEDIGRAVLASCGKAREVAREAFSLVPGLRAFSWLDPGLDNLLSRAPDPPAALACAEGARALATAATELGVSFRMCGRTSELPDAALRRSEGAANERTLLWFQRYSGRDEIVRAAGNYLAAHPDTPLADGELDAWLDTAGIPDPDLLLFVGGSLEPRDALLWQGSYAEISHSRRPMAAFSSGDLRDAVADYYDRQRRFGR